MTDIVMPQLSDSMESGTVLSWLKNSGEQVEVGDELLEIETDKSTIAHLAQTAGVLEIIAPEGATVAVGETIARLLDGQPLSHSGATAGLEAATAAGVVRDAAIPSGSGVEATSESNAERAVAAPAPGDASGISSANNGEGPGRAASPATPLARRVAAAHGVSLNGVAGTGPLGRITRLDVLKAAGLPDQSPALPAAGRAPATVKPAPAAASPAPVRQPGSALATSRREPSRLQQLIARRMVEAKATVPHFQVQTEVVMDSAIALRIEFKRLASERDVVPSFNDLIIKAAALALRNHPLANGSFIDDAFRLHEQINVGMAVAADEALIVPTIFDAADRSLGEIARESRRLAARVRSGEVSPAELEGGTFTVSNLGMFGMTAITPVINPPQAAILGVGATRETLARVDGEIIERSMLTLTLSCDHRILYGADAARFLAEIRDLLEAPLRIAL